MTTLGRRLLLGAALLGTAGFGVALAERSDAQDVAGGPRRACPTAPAIAAAPSATSPAAVSPTQTAAAPSTDPVETGAIDAKPDPYKTRIVVVEWKIKSGRECDFLDYWATRSTVPNRSGLVAEFLSEIDGQPWINWKLEEGYTTFYNVGIWRDAPAFQDQIGKYIDNNRPPLEFEAGKRARVFLAPERWRVGVASLPAGDAAGVR